MVVRIDGSRSGFTSLRMMDEVEVVDSDAGVPGVAGFGGAEPRPSPKRFSESVDGDVVDVFHALVA